MLELLPMCVGFPNPHKIQSVVLQYQDDPARKLFRCQHNGVTVGCIGVAFKQDKAILLHIAVSAHSRGQGFGKFMIGAVVSAYKLRHLEAETDEDAVGFYAKNGFIITSLGQVYSGLERFKCVLSTI